jgi:hypothetical protein
MAAAFGLRAGLLGLEHGLFEPGKAASFVLALILLSALAQDSQQSQPAPQTT